MLGVGGFKPTSVAVPYLCNWRIIILSQLEWTDYKDHTDSGTYCIWYCYGGDGGRGVPQGLFGLWGQWI